MILNVVNSIEMAGGFGNWCSTNGPMAWSSLLLFVLLLSIFVSFVLGGLLWTKYNLTTSNK